MNKSFSNHPLILTCPIVGAELTRETFPSLPLTPDELAQSACEAVQAGASIIHLHVRDDQGRPTQNPEIFEKVSKLIHSRCECILQFSTGGAVGTSVEERCAPLKLKPEMATLSLGTMNFGNEVFENSVSTISTISSEIQKNQILAELEVFDLGMLDNLPRFLKKKTLPSTFTIDFVLGVPGGMNGNLQNLLFLVHRWKEICIEWNLPLAEWSVAGVGSSQLPLATHAIAMGGHVRVGLEDNIYFSKGKLANSNAQLVKRIANISQAYGRPLANAAEARKILGLK